MRINCGHCKATHATVAEVRECAGLTSPASSGRISRIGDADPEPSQFLGLNESGKPSEKQMDFAHKLLRQRESYGMVQDAEKTGGMDSAHEVVTGMDRGRIGEFITQMKLQPLRSHEVRPSTTQVGEGIYRMEDDIYKVVRAVHGSGHLYAKRLEHVTDHEGKAKGTFVLAPGAISQLREEHRLGLEEAVKFGKLYGFCVRCGAILTDETSIERGIGPICAGKMMEM